MRTYKYHIFLIIGLLTFIFNLNVHSQPNFTLNKSNAEYCQGDTVKFTNTTTGAIEILQWNFGDNTDTWGILNPRHIYQTAGDFTIKLTVFYADGTTANKTMPISILAKPQLTLVNNQEQGFLTASTDVTPPVFKWYFNKTLLNETSASLYYYESGKYIAVTTNSAGCSD